MEAMSVAMWRLYLLSGCTLLFCSCAIAPAPAPAGTQYDGTYTGQDRLLSGVAFQCGAPDMAETIEVHDGRFWYPFQVSPPRVAPLPVEIAADGGMAGQMQYGMGEEIFGFSRDLTDWVLLRGRISGTTLDATITTTRCARRLAGQRNAN
jgi:hypothetical protein